MSTRRDYPTKELQDEGEHLAAGYIAQDELDIDEYLDRYASQSFKDYQAWFDEESEREKALIEKYDYHERPVKCPTCGSYLVYRDEGASDYAACLKCRASFGTGAL
jgi:Acetyl-CoA carboxylase beta subunit